MQKNFSLKFNIKCVESILQIYYTTNLFKTSLIINFPDYLIILILLSLFKLLLNFFLFEEAIINNYFELIFIFNYF